MLTFGMLPFPMLLMLLLIHLTSSFKAPSARRLITSSQEEESMEVSFRKDAVHELFYFYRGLINGLSHHHPVHEILHHNSTPECQTGITMAGKHLLIPDSDDRGAIDGYWLYMPSQWDPAKKWPVILFLQGINALGGTPEGSQKCGPVNYALYCENSDHQFKELTGNRFIIINPHLRKGDYLQRQWYNQADELEVILKDIFSKYSGNSRKVYLVGLSFGGTGVLGLGTRWKEKIAAMVSICGSTERPGMGDLTLLAPIPLWITANTGDAAAMKSIEKVMQSIEKSQGKTFIELQNIILPANNLNRTHIASFFQQQGHNAWDQTLSSKDLYLWMLQFSSVTGFQP